MKFVPKTVSRAIGRTVLRTQTSAPTLLFVAGLTTAVTATVLACKATLRLEEELDHIEKDLVDADNPQITGPMNMSQDDYMRMKAQIYAKGAWSIAKLYAPAVGVGIVSVVCLTKSHGLLKQREAAAAAAVVSLQNFLEGYRGRVRKTLGEEEEQRIYYAATPVELVEDTDKGPKKVYGSSPGQHSPYSVVFDDKNLNWQEADEYNRAFIRIQERRLTDKLREDGFLCLNQVYKRLGIVDTEGRPYQTEIGQSCGWFVGHPKSDDFVEIKILPYHDFQRTLLLDFNVAGMVTQMLRDVRQS